MKVCASCGAKIEDGVQECPVCCDTQFVNVCPNCSSPLDGDNCPVCGYLTDAAAARFGNNQYPVIKPLEKSNKTKYSELSIVYSVLGLFCPIFVFQIAGIVCAVKAMKSGDSFKTPFIAMIISVLGIMLSILAIEMFSPMFT